MRSPAAFIRPMSGTVSFFGSITKTTSSNRWSGRPSGAPEKRSVPLPARSPAYVLGAGQSRVAVLVAPSMRPVSVRRNPRPWVGSGSLPGSKRNVVLHPLSHGPDLLDQVGEVAAVLDEVDVRGVDHQEWGLG